MINPAPEEDDDDPGIGGIPKSPEDGFDDGDWPNGFVDPTVDPNPGIGGIPNNPDDTVGGVVGFVDGFLLAPPPNEGDPKGLFPPNIIK